MVMAAAGWVTDSPVAVETKPAAPRRIPRIPEPMPEPILEAKPATVPEVPSRRGIPFHSLKLARFMMMRAWR